MSEAKKMKLPEVKSSQYFVMTKEIGDALMVYLQDRPYKESAQLVQALGQSKILKNFMADNKIVD